MTVKRVVTKKVRLSYLHVFEPSAFENQEPKFSASIIIPKSDKETIAKIEKAVKAALEAGRVQKFGGKIPKVFNHPLRDGDEERPDDEAYADSYFLNARNSRRPGVVDKDLNPIIDPDELYSGCYGRVSLTPYSYSMAGNKGVAFALDNVQKLSDGEALGVPRPRPENDFDEIEDEDLM